MKQKSLIKNTVILFFAMTIAKILGAVLKIPLGNILGGVGMGYYSTAISLYMPVYSFLSAGIPIAITRLTAQNLGCGRFRTVKAVKSAAIRMTIFTGTIGTIAVYAVSVPFCNIIASSSQSIIGVYLIAPQVLFCCIAGGIKAYYEGLSDMIPTSFSQVIEALIKAVAGLFLANFAVSYFSSMGYSFEELLPYAAAAAILGITLGELSGTVFLIARNKIKGDGITKNDLLYDNTVPPRRRKIYKSILLQALPISINSIVININSFLDLLTIPSGITACLYTNPSFFSQRYGRAVFSTVAPSDFGTFVYGSYSGIVLTLFMLTTSLTALIGKSALPKIASLWECGNRKKLSKCIKSMFTGVFLLGIPLCFFLGTFSKPILELLYPSKVAEVEIAAKSLLIMGFGGFGVSLISAFSAIFQAIDKSYIPIKLMLFISGVKLIGNILLIKIPSVSVEAAAISTVISYSLAAIVGFHSLRKSLGFSLHISSCGVLALVASVIAVVCGGTSCYVLLKELPLFFRLAFSACAFGGVYLVAIAFLFKKQTLSLIKKVRFGLKKRRG